MDCPLCDSKEISLTCGAGMVGWHCSDCGGDYADGPVMSLNLVLKALMDAGPVLDRHDPATAALARKGLKMFCAVPSDCHGSKP